MLISEKLVERISEYTAPYSAIPNNRAAFFFGKKSPFMILWGSYSIINILALAALFQKKISQICEISNLLQFFLNFHHFGTFFSEKGAFFLASGVI